MSVVSKAVIPAAGLGTRFLPATKAIPKEMLPIVDKPLIQYIIEEVKNSGIDDVILITSKNKIAIENHFDLSYELEEFLRKKGKIEFISALRDICNMVHFISVRQREPLGLGHAVLCAKKALGREPFAVVLPDDLIDTDPPCLKQMLDVYNSHPGVIIALERIPKELSYLYGIVSGRWIGDRIFEISEMVEKPDPEQAPSDLAIIGRYILLPDILDLLENTPPGAGGEIQLTDAIARFARYGKVYGYLFSGKRFDAGDKVGFVKAQISFALKDGILREEVSTFLKELNL